MKKLKVYFACSIRGGGDKSLYPKFIETIKSEAQLLIEDALLPNGTPLPSTDIYSRDVAWINECDVMIAEVSNPSLGVGYEIAYAEKLGKPTLIFFSNQQEKRLSAMIEGNTALEICKYEQFEDAKTTLVTWLHSRVTL